MIRSTEEFRGVFKAARRAGTPLIAVRTADPVSTMRLVGEVVALENGQYPLASWDLMAGLRGCNEAGKAAVADLTGERAPESVGPADVLGLARKFREDGILFFLNAQRLWEQADVLQGIWNLREHFKAAGQTLVLLTTPGATLPVELQPDVMVIDEPLPSADDLARLVTETFDSAALKAPDQETVSKAVDALIGLAAFPAEQVLAMSLSKKGLNTERLWERKRQAAEQTPGLSIWRGGETFEDIGGCGNIKINTAKYARC